MMMNWPPLLFCSTLAVSGVNASHHVSSRRAFGLRQQLVQPVDISIHDKEQQQSAGVSTVRPASAVSSIPRGGACDDSNAALFGKVGVSVILEAAGLMGVFALGKAGEPILTDLGIPSIFGTSPSLWVAFFVVVFATSLVGTFVDGGASAALNQSLDPNTTPGDPDWYMNLKKPSWNPPGWVFPIMWLIVSKPTQLSAVNKLWSVTDGADRGWRLLAYCTHLALGDAWNKTFFGYQCVGRGVVVISTFFAMLLSSAFLFWQADPLAGKLMLPTCGWVAVATALNWSIYLLNRPETSS